MYYDSHNGQKVKANITQHKTELKFQYVFLLCEYIKQVISLSGHDYTLTFTTEFLNSFILNYISLKNSSATKKKHWNVCCILYVMMCFCVFFFLQ